MMLIEMVKIRDLRTWESESGQQKSAAVVCFKALNGA